MSGTTMNDGRLLVLGALGGLLGIAAVHGSHGIVRASRTPTAPPPKARSKKAVIDEIFRVRGDDFRTDKDYVKAVRVLSTYSLSELQATLQVQRGSRGIVRAATRSTEDVRRNAIIDAILNLRDVRDPIKRAEGANKLIKLPLDSLMETLNSYSGGVLSHKVNTMDGEPFCGLEKGQSFGRRNTLWGYTTCPDCLILRPNGSLGVVRASGTLKKVIPAAQPDERPIEKDLDEHAVNDLVLATTSDGDLYKNAQMINATLAKHLAKDRFSRTQGAKAFEYLADAGARKTGWDQYEQPRAKHWMDQKYPTYYPAKVRRAASWDLLDHYTEEIEELAAEIVAKAKGKRPRTRKTGSKGIVRGQKRALFDHLMLPMTEATKRVLEGWPEDEDLNSPERRAADRAARDAVLIEHGWTRATYDAELARRLEESRQIMRDRIAQKRKEEEDL